MKIDELDLSVRSYNALKRARIDTVEELREMDNERLKRVHGLDAQSIEEIRLKLQMETNGDWYRSMKDETLAAFIDCPHGIVGAPYGCERDEDCYHCCLKFLREPFGEVKE